MLPRLVMNMSKVTIEWGELCRSLGKRSGYSGVALQRERVYCQKKTSKKKREIAVEVHIYNLSSQEAGWGIWSSRSSLATWEALDHFVLDETESFYKRNVLAITDHHYDITARLVEYIGQNKAQVSPCPQNTYCKQSILVSSSIHSCMHSLIKTSIGHRLLGSSTLKCDNHVVLLSDTISTLVLYILHFNVDFKKRSDYRTWTCRKHLSFEIPLQHD